MVAVEPGGSQFRLATAHSQSSSGLSGEGTEMVSQRHSGLAIAVIIPYTSLVRMTAGIHQDGIPHHVR